MEKVNLILGLSAALLSLLNLFLDYGRYQQEIRERRDARLTPTSFQLPQRDGDPVTFQFTVFNTGNRDVAILDLALVWATPSDWKRPTTTIPGYSLLATTTQGLPTVLSGGRVAALTVSADPTYEGAWSYGSQVAPHRPDTRESSLWLVAKVADDRAVVLNQWHPLMGWYVNRQSPTERVRFAGLSNERLQTLNLFAVSDLTVSGALNSFDPDSPRQVLPDGPDGWWSYWWSLIRSAIGLNLPVR